MTEARQNFRRYWVMYSPDRDTRITRGDSDTTLAAKRAMVEAFDAMVGVDAAKRARLWETVQGARATLDAELHRRVREYERQISEKRAE